MGEDTDGMVESTSKLRDLVKGITGFDIMQDEQTYKSIYEIVLGIGEVWKDLSDVDQAALLEKLAGKTQSNALAAALNNVDILKEAYQTAEDSMGSAMEEQQRFSEGLQYHLNQFNQARESLSHNLVDSDLLKFFVDLGTIGVESIDKITQSIGGLSVIISSFMVIGGLKTKDGGPLLYFTEFGKQITSLIHTVASAKGLGGVTKAIEGIGEIGTTAIGMGGVVALSAAFTMAYKAYDNYVHKYSDSMNAMRKHTSGIEDQKKEIESLNEEYQSVQDKITEINNMGGAKVSREGELEQLQAQSKELERQIALKEASAKVELGKAYKEAQKATSAVVEAPDQVDINAINAEMTREEYLKTNFGIYGGSKTKTRVSVDKAIPRMIAQYDALIAKRKEYQDQVDKLSHNKSGAYDEGMALDNADSINEAREKIEEYNLSIEESREQLVQWYNDVQDRADVIETYAEYGHILDENDKATIALAKSTKEQLDAMDDAEAAANGAASGQNSLHNSVVKTKEQMASQKTAVDNLISSYRELFELSTKGDGLDVVLDDDQLTKYGNALEYVNGVYKLNTDKLFELAEANNQAKISELDHEKQLANMKYLKNAKEIEIYNNMLKEGKSLTEDGGSIKGRIANLKAENQAIIEQNNIRNYQISQLENVTSAYQKWLAVSGQEVDAKAFTGVQDAAKSIDDLIKKGKIGLDSYKLAVDFVIPTNIDHEDTEAVQKYIKNNITPYFTEDRTGIDKFLKKSQYFEHDKEYGGYVLKEGTSVNDIAKDMGWTVEVTRAMIDQLETFGGKFKWDIEGMFSDTDKLVHYQEELAKINEEKDKFNLNELSEADSERFDELNNQADALIAKIDELQGKVNKTTFNKINKGVEESGGVEAVHKGYEQLVELGADQQTISDYVKKTTGVTTPQEVQIYTDEAQKNIDDLIKRLHELDEASPSVKDTEQYEQEYQKLTDDLKEQGIMVQMLNEVLLEDNGVSTEETVSKIASILTEISGYVGTIAAREPEEKPSGDEGKGNTGGGGKPVFNSNDFNGELPEGLQDTHVVYTLEADTSNAEEGLETTTDAAKKAEGPWSIRLGETGGSLIKSTLDSISAKIRELKANKHIINIGIQTTGSVPKMGGLNDEVSAKGNVFANGNAFARGNDIVGEQGRELVVDPNRGIWYTVGDSGTEMIDLPKDAIVYSHNQTEALLKSGVTTRGKSKGRSFANGTEQQYVFGNIDLRHRQPYYWDDGSVSTVLGTSYGMDELSFAVATLLQGNDVRPLGDGEIIWYLEQLVSRSHDPETIYALDRQGFTDEAGNWLHDLIAYVGTDAAYAEYVSSIMHVISDEYERSIGTYARGNAFANGTLVGERGRELIVDPNSGRWYTVGDYGSEMINLPKDAIVYNHQQTEDLLKNGHTSRGHSTGASFASGNAYVRVEDTDGSGGGRKNGKQGVTGGIPDAPKGYKASAKAAADAAKSAEKAAKGAKDAADEAKTTIDWIDRAIEYQTREIKKWKDIVDDEYEPYENRFDALDQYTEQLIDQQEVLYQAIERRNEKFEEDAQKLRDAIGEEKAEVILERVVKGDVDPLEWLQKFEDEFGKENAEKYYKMVVELQTDQKNIEAADDAYRDNIKEQREAEQERYKMRLNIIKAEKENLDYEMDLLQHNLDMKDILGKMVVEQDYQDMIDQTDEIASNLREQLEVLEEQADSLDPTSEAYASVQSDIHSIKKDLLECEKNQAEWNDKIMRLPIERIDRYINMLNNIKKDLENWSAEQNVLGIDTTAKTIEQRFDIAQRAIKKYNEQVDKYRDLLSHYEYGSDKFEETANSIQDCEDNVSSLIQEMRELNIQFLKLPIDDITKANEKLQNINTAEQRVLDDYDTALSAVLSKFDQLIDKRNDEIDILNKRYDEMIKPYQDQLDLLNEQNEAKQMQYNIDKAQYDLDKARQQKNVQVVRNGRIEYDSDIDALKSAQDNLNNAKHDKAVYDLQQQIDALEKERDSKIEPLEKEIEKLEDARNRWQTFEDERTFEKEAAEAVRLLGANWEKAIEGTITNPHSDDREYDIFSKNHIQLDRQITNNEKQIENNERMIDLMTRYVDAYMSGEMTYEEARSQYDKLYKDYQSGATLTSQESLAAELAFNRAKDMGDALRLNNAETKKSYDSFLGQLEKANEYNKTIDKYTKTWDEINESITKQLAELERLAALAEEIAAQRRSSGGGRSSGGDSDGGGGVWSKNPTGYGAGTKYNPYGKGTLYEGDAVFTGKSLAIDSGGGDTSVHADSVTVISSRDADTSHKDSGPGSSSKSSGKSHYNHSSPSGPASDSEYTSRGKGPHAFADGLAMGMVGGLNPSEKFKKLQAMGLKPLEPDEVPAFLHVGEGVVNAIQQSNILKSVGNAFKAGVASIPTDAVKSVENNYNFDCQFGDFILPNVEDTNGFASAMKNNFESIMNQQFSKIF